MQYNCSLIADLLPLYADNVCSEESRKAVAEHIAECSQCRSTLEKMNSKLVITADNDIKVIKRIKKRIKLERIVIGLITAVAVYSLGGGICFSLLNTEQTMDYEKYDLAHNVIVEEDNEGNVWLIKQGSATEAWMLMPWLRDSSGNYGENTDLEAVNGLAFTLKERKINDFFVISMDSESEWQKERTLIFNKNEKKKMDSIYYYDDVSGTEYLLWERNE